MGFLILFTAFLSCQSISAKIMKDLGFENLGFVNLAVLYLSFSFSALFAPGINRFLGTKKTLLFGGLTFCFWILCFLLPAYKQETKADDDGIYGDAVIRVLNVASAAVLGFGSGPLWVS